MPRQRKDPDDPALKPVAAVFRFLAVHPFPLSTFLDFSSLYGARGSYFRIFWSCTSRLSRVSISLSLFNTTDRRFPISCG